MKKIKYCTENFLDEFKTNFDKYIPYYKNKDIDELKDIFNDPRNVLESNIEFNYIDLKNSKNSSNPDRENIKIIYDTLGHLKPGEAIQEKLWLAMYNTYYLDHLMDYIDLNKNNKNFEDNLKGTLLFKDGKTRALIVQKLARFWWIGHKLYDDKNKINPYHLIDFYTSTKDIVGKSTVFLSSNFNNNKNILLGIVEGIEELCNQKIIENKRKYYVEINKHFNLIGGVQILDIMEREEVKLETIRHLKEFSASQN